MRPRVFILIVASLIIPAGCMSKSGQLGSTTETAAIGRASRPSDTPTPRNSDFTPSASPEPTLSAAQRLAVAALLRGQTCKLPCYLGLRPGQTLFDEADTALKNLGGYSVADYENWSLTGPDRPAVHLRQYELLYPGASAPVYQDIYLSGVDARVQQLVIDVFSNREASFYEGWQTYSLENILKTFGAPDRILIRTDPYSFGIRAQYLRSGLILDWTGAYDVEAGTPTICPQWSRENITSLTIAIADTASYFEIVPSTFQGSSVMWKDVGDVLGMNTQMFADKMSSGQSPCFAIAQTSP